ncbi:protein polyglycylase TTLL10-like, partial [Petaurus breviceps papuanus]|uniref:protein polyglycylase TTLL10-like n=1 Tax=Petaurus breviceps papuanus TaxID=3040969 RepID=UPI0036D78F83
VWLLEMNSNPALHTNCEVLKDVVPRVVHETLDLALETFHKSLRTEKMLPLLSQRNFVLLHSGEDDLWPRSVCLRGPIRPLKLSCESSCQTMNLLSSTTGSSSAKASDRSSKKLEHSRAPLKRAGLLGTPGPVHPKSALHLLSPSSMGKGQSQSPSQDHLQAQPSPSILSEEPEPISDSPTHMLTLLRPLASGSSDFWFQGALDMEPPILSSNDLFLPLYPSRMLSLSFPSEPIPPFDTPSPSEVQDTALDSFLGIPEYERKDVGHRGS